MPERRKRMNPLLLVLIALLVTFVAIRMLTAPTTLEVVKTLELPEFPNIEHLDDDADEKIAVAVDGQIAYKNSEEAQPTASTAKMLLALMVMEKKPFSLGETGETITINQDYYKLYAYYTSHGGSHTRVVIGEEISEYDALASALLPSSNNMADTLAIWAFGSLEEYKTYATSRLADWGLEHTTIGTDASGFSETTTSTASDLAQIAYRLMQNPVLAEIVGLTDHEVPVVGEIENTNKLLGEHGIIGVKTGYIGDPSGYCLVSAYKEDDHIITTAVLNAETRDGSFEKTSDVAEKLQETLTATKIASADQEIGYYESWWAGKTPIYAKSDTNPLAWSSVETSASLDMPAPESSEASGALKVKIGSSEESFDTYAKDIVYAPSFFDRLLHAFFIK